MTQVFVSIGECMVELSVTAEGLYRRGFAGDTLNTAWGVRGLASPTAVTVHYLTRVGDDALSDEMIGFIAEAGIGTGDILRMPGRPVGLYMIALQGHERTFTYWRDASAARELAADVGALRAGTADANCIYFSGITLAILTPEHRENLFTVLDEARSRGAMVVFDANVRPRLWPGTEALRAGIEAGYRAATIALPTFPDEASLFNDGSPLDAARRIADYGVEEIVVKDGAEPCTLYLGGEAERIPAIRVDQPLDTTGAGDSFNAGYIAARLAGRAPVEAVAMAHRVAAEVIRTRGALLDMATLRKLAAGTAVS